MIHGKCVLVKDVGKLLIPEDDNYCRITAYHPVFIQYSRRFSNLILTVKLGPVAGKD